MRFLLASIPYDGHLPPIAALSQELARQGHNVELWTAETATGHRILERVAPDCKHCYFPHPFTPEEEAQLWVRPPPATHWEGTCRFAQMFGDKHRPNPYKHIDESVSASRPDLMITDFMTFGAWDVAEKHKIPLVIAVTCPVSIAIHIMGASSLWRNFTTPAEGAVLPFFALPSWERMSWFQRLVVNPALKIYFPLAWRYASGPINARARTRLGLPPNTPFRGADPNTVPRHMVLLMTVPQLETPLPLPPHWFVSSILSRDFTQPPPPLPEGNEIRAWLEQAQAAGDHVVYVATGSIIVLTQAQVLSMVTAFLTLSCSPATLGFTLQSVTQISEGGISSPPPGIRFLWSIKEQAAGWLPKELPQDKILARPWVAQPSVLAHPAVSLYVTHAGMNSVMESLAAGKPMFALPKGADQFINAQHLSNKGVGESLPLHHLSPDSLVSGVTKVLCDPGYRRRASHLSDSIRGSPGIKQAVGRVLGFAEGEVQT